jgi:hypothetical protein
MTDFDLLYSMTRQKASQLDIYFTNAGVSEIIPLE